MGPAGRTRRNVLQRILTVGLSLPFVGALVAMVRGVDARQRPTISNIPTDVAAGLSVVGAVIVHRDDDGTIRAFSARCTHLGCRIDRIVGDEAVCPCHGSRFRADGSVAAGPASRPLAPLTLEPDPPTGGWTARVT